MTTLIDDLAKDHARFRRFLNWYRQEIGKLARGEKPDYLLLDMLARYFAYYPDELHHKKEDIIFKFLRAKAGARKAPLADLHQQHEELSEKANRFADIVGKVLSDQELPIDRVVEEAAAYADALAAHMEGEEDSLFKPARALLTSKDWSRIQEEVGEIYATKAKLEKAQQVLALERELEAYDRPSSE